MGNCSVKRFICCLLSALLFTMPIYADEIQRVEKIGGIEKIGDIATGDITAIEGNALEFAPRVKNLKSGLDEEYTFYSQLSDAGKQYYDNLKENVSEMSNGTETVSAEITVNVGSGLALDTALKKAANLGFEAAKKAIVAFWYDNPQYFWYDINKLIFSAGYYPRTSYDSDKGTFLIIIHTGVNTNKGYTNYYPDGYSTQEEIETDWNKMEQTKNDIMSNMDGTGSDFEKVKYINDWLCDNNTYNNETKVTKMRYQITSAMVYGAMGDDYKEKYPVCQGYAFALKYLCDEANIPCTVVTSATHMWNLVKLKDEYYVIDTTWNDNYKDFYIAKGVKDTNLYCYRWLAIGSDKVTSFDQDSAHTHSIECDFTVPTSATDTLLESLGIASYADTDTNNDCTLSRADIAAVLKNANGTYTVTKDVNGDGEIDLKDGINLSKLLLK